MTPAAPPKGALTRTARQSKRLFLGYFVLTALALPVVVLGLDGNGRWLRLAVLTVFVGGALAYLRSWRTLKRSEAGSHRSPQ